MKRRIFTTFLLVLISAVVLAQDNDNPTRKGRWIGDLEVGFTSGDIKQDQSTYTSDAEIKNNLFDVQFGLGYTVADNLSVGLVFFTEHQNLEADFPDIVGFPGTATSEREKVTNNLLGAQIRYYFLEERAKPFLGGAAGLALVDVEVEEGPTTAELSGSGFGYLLEAGFAYFINDSIGLEVVYNYFSSSTSLDGSGATSGFNFALENDETTTSSSLSVGVTFAF